MEYVLGTIKSHIEPFDEKKSTRSAEPYTGRVRWLIFVYEVNLNRVNFEYTSKSCLIMFSIITDRA